MKRRKVRSKVNPRGSKRKKQMGPAVIACHPEPVVSVIIPVMNEARTLANVIRESSRVHPRTEVIVVANGCRDGSAELARQLGAKVLEFEEPLGHDVPRAEGAKAAQGDVLLFVDGDMAVRTEELKPFVSEILAGGDLALNDYSGPVQAGSIHPVISSKFMLNSLLGRPDLKGASLTAVPHALSRRAVTLIGAASLSNPPVAYTAAVLDGLRVRAVHYVNVGSRNRRRKRPGQKDLLTPLVAGDHLEAACRVLELRGPRGGFPDLGRLRERAR
ncbi:hypothetical protein AWM70_14135 [Paenibacillus yonginensis]|uniref:4,4'-diaponeurosporenoate glycosyltransferase n=1 Tax=Paenibacillus yonginensis TaxID=1462996 RepID=A0A1B1N2D0_9BACL|nr:glycosyltransferase [Paenibacillus yonginensis]ANS75594.1 hypothetical protein AWM70_14135 [Paenibacillus yonginensis]